MNEADSQKPEDGEAGTDWNEEYDAWLELIEDHLKAIRRGQVIMIILLALLTLLTAFIYFPWLLRYLR